MWKFGDVGCRRILDVKYFGIKNFKVYVWELKG